jgi:hypothetical protein
MLNRMDELVDELTMVMDSDFEWIAGKGKWLLNFERLKADNVKELYRIYLKSNTIWFYSVSHDTDFKGIQAKRPDDEIEVETVEDIIEYLYSG